jgi:hypothetical protein
VNSAARARVYTCRSASSQALAQHIAQRLTAAADVAAVHDGPAPAHHDDAGGMRTLQSWETQQPSSATHAAVDMASLTADVAAVAAEVIGQPVDPDQPLMEASCGIYCIEEHSCAHAVCINGMLHETTPPAKEKPADAGDLTSSSRLCSCDL